MVHMAGAGKRFEAEVKGRRVLAFNIAALTRAKKLPNAREFIAGGPIKATGDDALAMLRAHAARLPKRSWEEWQKLSSGR
jgi:hypothetical protein